MTENGDPLPGFDRRAFAREAASVLARDVDLAVGDVDVGKVMYELIDVSFRNRLRVPAEEGMAAPEPAPPLGASRPTAG